MNRLNGAGVCEGRSGAARNVAWVLVALCAGATIVPVGAMAPMGELPMSGGWSLSMAWMPMCGQGRSAAALSFLGMWMLMMASMMLPVLLPMLLRYRQALVATGQRHPGGRTALAGAGYFSVWAACGMAVYPAGAALALGAMRSVAVARAFPAVAGAAVVLAGAIQFSAWKARGLACCREAPEHALRTARGGAWWQGVTLGVGCLRCCANLTAVGLVTGMMEPAVMGALTAAIAIERLAPARKAAARTIGFLVVGAGLWLIVRAAARA